MYLEILAKRSETSVSSACRISNVSISFKSRYTLSTNTAGWGNYNVKANAMIYTSMPSISGTSANAGTGSHGSVFAAYSKNNVSSSSSYASYTFSGSPANAAGETIYGGSKGLVCAGFPLSHNGNLDCRIWLSECTFTVTRTRACYITFTGEGITTTKKMYDYNTVPSFGSAQTRDGYTFKGWKSSANGNVYQGALPTAYESDVTYTAQWERTYPVFQSISINDLNIRKGPGTNYAKTGRFTGKGVFTIVAVSDGKGATKWGKLKSGAGWISLDYTTRI